MNVTKRQKRRIRNLVCIQYSIVKMLLVIAGFELLGRGLSLMQGTQSATQEIEGEVIWSEETKTEENPLIVCVDAGHGGKDNGSDYKGRYEKDDNLKLAQAVAAYLADKNVKVVMTRSDDTFLRLSERCGIANQSGADYMLSLHRNDGEGNGVETWISASGSEETDALANHIMEALDTAGIPSLTVEQQQEEVMGNHQYIKDTFGYEMNLFRYPAGKFSEQSLAVVNNCGYESVFWSFAYLDYDVDNQPDQAESLQKMKNKMHPGAIYLLHAESATNAAVLGDLIDAAQTQGYSFGTL